MAMKHGYKTVEEYKEGVQKKFSLLENGIIQQPSTRLLLINVSSLAPVPELKGMKRSIISDHEIGYSRWPHAHRGLDDVVRVWLAQGGSILHWRFAHGIPHGQRIRVSLDGAGYGFVVRFPGFEPSEQTCELGEVWW